MADSSPFDDNTGGLVAKQGAGDNAAPLTISEISSLLKRVVEDRFGYVRVRGELWRAVATPGDVLLKSGTEVEVIKADRMELLVRRNDVWSHQADRDAAKSKAHD